MKTDNEIIAEFMGALKKRDEHEGMKCILLSGGGVPVSGWYYQDSEIKYSTSWDWLMPVVERIETLELPVPNPEMYTNPESEHTHVLFQSHSKIAKVWYPYENHNPIITTAGHTKIEAVYGAVVEFIKWYNSKEANL